MLSNVLNVAVVAIAIIAVAAVTVMKTQPAKLTALSYLMRKFLLPRGIQML
jgi:hypothetical protein